MANRRNLLLLTVLIILCNLISLSRAQGTVSTNIVGGSDATPGQCPYCASLQFYNKHYCGCFVIDKNWLITAAHCIYTKNNTLEPISKMSIRAGSIYSNSGGQVRPVSKLVPNPDFKYPKNDICLLKVSSPFIFNTNLQPIALASKMIPPGTPVDIYGWGATATGTGSVITLKWNTLTVAAQNISYPNPSYSDDTAFCCEKPNGNGNGICFGDSGGPAVYNDIAVGCSRSMQAEQCGTTSFDCFTNISYQYSWILRNMKTPLLTIG